MSTQPSRCVVMWETETRIISAGPFENEGEAVSWIQNTQLDAESGPYIVPLMSPKDVDVAAAASAN